MSIWCNLHQFAPKKHIIYSNSPLPWRPCGAPAVAQRIDAKSGDRTQHWGWFVLNCIFFLKIIIKLKQSQESKFHAEVTKLTLKKWRLKNGFFSRVQRKENCIRISFCEWLKYVSLMGFGEWDWWSEKCEFNFLKIIRPIAAGLYRQIQFTVQLRKLKSPSHPAVQQMWIKSNIREIFPAMHQAEKRKTKENTHRYTNANTNKIFFRVSHSYTPYTGRRQRGCDSSR